MRRLRDRQTPIRCFAGEPLHAAPTDTPAPASGRLPGRHARLGIVIAPVRRPTRCLYRARPSSRGGGQKNASDGHDERTRFRQRTANHPADRVHPCRLRSDPDPRPATRDRHPAASPRSVAKVVSELARVGITRARKFSAVDGATLTEAALRALVHRDCVVSGAPTSHTQLTRPAIGCF